MENMNLQLYEPKVEIMITIRTRGGKFDEFAKIKRIKVEILYYKFRNEKVKGLY
jgi:hypothetical protein